MKKILIVEDEHSLSKALVDKLEGEGFETSVAYDGGSGLEMAIMNQPDVILLDIALPTMDGFEMLTKLREDAWGATAKVIVLTNIGDMEKISSFLEKGVTEYLVKSDWKIEDVINKVKDLVN